MEESQKDMVRKRSHLSAEENYQISLQATMAKAKANLSGSYLSWPMPMDLHTS